MLLDLIAKREAHVVVIGGGYVGLPLAVELARAKFHVTVYDRDAARVDLLNRSVSYIEDVSTSVLAPLVTDGKLGASSSPTALASADVVIVCVPTPLNKTREPDNSFVMAAVQEIAAYMNPPQLIVLESTTFPGFTREVMLPKLEGSFNKLDRDFYLAFSPERVDPANRTYGLKNTPKVIGGVSKRSSEVAQALYSTIVERLVPVSSSDAAETIKLLENTFRSVNIALINEIALMCRKLGLDTREVIDAAATKPFGFMPFYPGPGVGGHCIGPDPLYLAWKLRTLKYNPRFITLADEVNCAMPEAVVDMAASALNERGKAVNGARVLIAGVAYKRDVADTRESPALDIIEGLERRGAIVEYTDPHVPKLGARLSRTVLPSNTWDCLVIVTDHGGVDYGALAEAATVVIDTRGALRGRRGNVVSL